MANTTPLVLDSVFFPFGKEPRQFDAFYLGSKEAFSKKGAEVVLDFEMADTTFTALSAGARRGVCRSGARRSRAGRRAVPAGGERDHGRHRQVPRTRVAAAAAGRWQRGCFRRRPADRRPQGRLPVWHDAQDPDGFLIAASAGDAVWVWRENSGNKKASQWIPFGSVPTTRGKAERAHLRPRLSRRYGEHAYRARRVAWRPAVRAQMAGRRAVDGSGDQRDTGHR